MSFLFVILLIIESLVINILKNSNSILVVGDTPAVFCIIINSLFLIFLLLKRKNEINGIKNFNIFICVSYIIRVVFLFWDRYFRNIFIFPNSGLDTGSFNNWAISFIENGRHGYSGYAAVLGWIYTFFSSNPLWGQYINVIASVITIIVLYKSLCLLDIHYKYKYYGIIFICFMPNYLIMSAILLRESFITMFLTLTIYYLLKWWFEGENKDILASFSYSLFATYLHSGTIAYTLALIIVIAFSNKKEKKIQFQPTQFIISLFLLSITLFIYIQYGDTFFGYLKGLDSIEDIVNKPSTYATGNSAYNVSFVEDSSLFGLLINSPLRVFYFLSSPLPWDWRGIGDIIAFLGSSLFYSVSVIEGVKVILKPYNKNKEIVIILLIFVFCSAIVYSWGVSNSGTALRHRDKFISNFILLLMVALNANNKNLKKNHSG